MTCQASLAAAVPAVKPPPVPVESFDADRAGAAASLLLLQPPDTPCALLPAAALPLSKHTPPGAGAYPCPCAREGHSAPAAQLLAVHVMAAVVVAALAVSGVILAFWRLLLSSVLRGNVGSPLQQLPIPAVPWTGVAAAATEVLQSIYRMNHDEEAARVAVAWTVAVRPTPVLAVLQPGRQPARMPPTDHASLPCKSPRYSNP